MIFFNRTIFWYIFYSVCRGKSTEKKQQQGNDNKIEEMYMVSIKRRWATVPQHVHEEIQTLMTKTNPPKDG
jgi:hypothetical protein